MRQRCDLCDGAQAIADAQCRVGSGSFDVAWSLKVAHPYTYAHAHPRGGRAAYPAYAASDDDSCRTAACLLLPHHQQRPLLRAR